MKSPSIGMLAALAVSAVAVSVGAAVAGMFSAGVTLAGPGCPDKPGVCPPAQSDPGRDIGNILAE